MGARSQIQRIGVALAIVLAFGSAVSAEQVLVYSGSFNLPIPAPPDTGKAWMVPDATINIPDHLTIIDLDVGITLTHTKVFDLQIHLKNPAGDTLILNTYDIHEYFDGEDYTRTVFDDEADVSIEQAAPPFTGRFKPRAPGRLDVFDGQDAYGTWRLRIYDQQYADIGALEEFELIITIPEPATAIILLLGAPLVFFRKPPARLAQK